MTPVHSWQLNADYLDGKDASEFATSGHDHDAAYAATGHNHDSAYSAAAHSHTALTGALQLGGDSSNHVAIATDGTLTLVGTARVWDDIRIEPVSRTIGTFAPTFEQWLTNGSGSRGVYLYSFDDAASNAEKEIFFTLQLPHAWAQTAIHLHVHFVPAATVNSSAVRWGLEYTWTEPNAVYGNTTLVYASVAEGTPANMTALTHYITEFAPLTPSATQDGFSSTLIGRLWRNSSHADDTYTDKVGLLYIDAHIELDKLGSNGEYV